MKEERSANLTEASTISLGLLLVLLGAIAGGVFYVATKLSEQESFSKRLDKMEVRQDEYATNLQDVKSDLREIKGYLKGKGK